MHLLHSHRYLCHPRSPLPIVSIHLSHPLCQASPYCHAIDKVQGLKGIWRLALLCCTVSLCSRCINGASVHGVVKIGMFGATTGTMHDIDVAPKHLKAVTIRSINTIDRLTFHFDDEKGNQHMGGKWGGNLGNDHTFYLDHDEYLNQVSGTFGPFDTQKLPCTVNSLTFFSNKGKKYGPFGTPGAKDTAFNIPVENGSIVGFYARADRFVSAIGFYVHP